MARVRGGCPPTPPGVHTRRYLESHYARICSRLKGAGKPVSAMMLDIDRFKSVNDVHGHDVGDEVLQGVAKRILSNLRGFDTAARYGGEDFAVILRNASFSSALLLADQLRAGVQSPQLIRKSTGDTLGTWFASVMSSATCGGRASEERLSVGGEAGL